MRRTHQISLLKTLVVFATLLGFQPSVFANESARLIESERAPAIALADKIWRLAELGYQETQSSDELQRYLSDRNFRITSEVANIPTAFVASYGKGKPIISILAEFDALPGLSQDAVPERKPIVDNGAGHACGHHLFGAASASAAVAIAKWLRESGKSGTVQVIGTPAEEGGSGKVYLTRAGVFDDSDVVMHWHPSDRNDASPSSTTANKSGRFEFHGVAAHAASAPHRGRSALDGVEAMNYMVNLMREHVPTSARMHYVITDGGDAPNIVPEFAEVYYYVRHPDPAVAEALFERVVQAANAAAMGTETRMELEVMHGNYPLLPNDVLAELMHENLSTKGGIQYDKEEQAFAETIVETLGDVKRQLGSEQTVSEYQFVQRFGSTDVGDVSWAVPTVGLRTATWVPGTSAHSWQAVAAGGMSIGHKGMLLAAEVLAETGIELMTSPDVIKEAWEEMRTRQGEDFQYRALLGDRDPPLNYRAPASK